MNTILVLGDKNVGKTAYVNYLKNLIIADSDLYNKMIEGNFEIKEHQFHETYYDNIAAFVMIDELNPNSMNVAKRIIAKYRLSYKDNNIVLLIRHYSGMESYNYFFEQYNVLTKCPIFYNKSSFDGMLDSCLKFIKNKTIELNKTNNEMDKTINESNKNIEVNSYIKSIIKISKLKHELKEKYVEYVYSEEYQNIKIKVNVLNNIIGQIIITNDSDLTNNILNALICYERS